MRRLERPNCRDADIIGAEDLTHCSLLFEPSAGSLKAALEPEQVAHSADMLKKLLLLNDTEGFSV